MSQPSQHNPDGVRAFDEPRFNGFERRAGSEPSPASSERPKRARRVFTAADKLRILQEAASSSKRGEIEALLRREAIYSSHLAAWRKQLALRGREGLEGAKPGRKPKLDARDHRILELERRVQFLERELDRVTGNTERELDRVTGNTEHAASLAVTADEAC